MAASISWAVIRNRWPLRRTLQRHVESPLSRRILRGEFQPGDHVIADVGKAADDGKGLVFEKQGPIPVELPRPVRQMEEVPR